MTARARRLLAGLLALSLAAPAASRADPGPRGPAPPLSDAPPARWSQSGLASWYGGPEWNGNRTSSGAVFDDGALTAAHATLPLGSKVKVALDHSRRAVVVTITDRPGTRARIIDLSRGAAAQLGILERGVAMVTLSPL